MRKTPNTKKIGLFTLGGLVLFFIILTLSLKDRFFINKNDLVVFYFEESIKGLNIGSPVMFKGVSIGKVTDIQLDVSSKNTGFKIPVIAQIKTFYSREEFKNHTNEEVLKYFINQGLRAQLSSQNMLTGQLLISLEFKPDTKAIYRGEGKNMEYVEIPTILSEIEAITNDIKKIPLNEIMGKLDILLDTLNASAPSIMTQINRFVSDLNSPENLIAGNNLVFNLNEASSSISKAAKALRVFTDYLERNPQALIMGKGQ